MADKELREREKDRDLREISRDLRDIKDVKNIKDAVTRNLVWIITTLVSIGVWIGTIMFQGKTIDAQGSLLANTTDRVMACEKVDIKLSGADERIEGRLTGISLGIKELKESIREMDARNQSEFRDIKKILYKPISGADNRIGTSNLASVVSI